MQQIPKTVGFRMVSSPKRRRCPRTFPLCQGTATRGFLAARYSGGASDSRDPMGAFSCSGVRCAKCGGNVELGPLGGLGAAAAWANVPWVESCRLHSC